VFDSTYLFNQPTRGRACKLGFLKRGREKVEKEINENIWWNLGQLFIFENKLHIHIDCVIVLIIMCYRLD
jgi:hypothetical protein